MKKNSIYILIALGLVDFLGAIDLTGIIVALPKMTQDLNLTVPISQWILNAYTLTLVASLILFGKLGDIVGPKKLFKIGLIIFGLASLMLGFANSILPIILIRAIQGIGTAILFTMSTTIVAHLWEEKEKAFAVTASFFSIGMLIGPVIGGLFAGLTFGNFQGWHLFFLMNVPLIIIALILANKFVPNIETTEKRKIDYFSSFLLFVFLGLLVFFLSTMKSYALVGSIFALIAFIFYDKSLKNPTFDFHLFRENNFLFANLLSFFIMVSTIGLSLALTFYFQEKLGWSPIQTGLAILPVPLVTVIFSIIGGKIKSRKLGAFLSASLVFTGILVIWLIGASVPYTKGILIGLILVGAGSGLLMTSVVSTILYAVEREKYGVASGILNTIQELGGLVGIALISAVVLNYSKWAMILVLISLIGLIFSFFIRKRVQNGEIQ